MTNVAALKRWRRSFTGTPERTIGQIAINKNGSYLDIWLRVNGKPTWVAVLRSDVEAFLASDDEGHVFVAESSVNSEADYDTDARETIAAEEAVR